MSAIAGFGMGTSGPEVAQVLYEDALECLQGGEYRRAQTKLRLALAYEPAFTEARQALDRLTI